ncbi:hypothetical protein Kpho01_75930 [Kitasatospora phosalacinea]|uniref:Uncharacterized protein n=1 Tax=Kitasatospora phosalacinea TaxID=2065 RepID=A0A9W6PRJ7_9ACTN|nr:hypothetical protein Kpho01_75930 [Kitasatospora phosalacinea]
MGDVVAVAAGQCDGERGTVPVDDQVVFAARPAPVDRRGSGVSPLILCEGASRNTRPGLPERLTRQTPGSPRACEAFSKSGAVVAVGSVAVAWVPGWCLRLT